MEYSVKEHWAREATAEIFDTGFAHSGREKAHQRMAQLIFGQLKKDNLVIDLG
jgi:hypothetical protein